jgi:hypothetical protein
METMGLKSEQVFAVRGFADRQLRNVKDPLDFQNRRVSIIVMFQGPKKPEVLEIPTLKRGPAFPRTEGSPPAVPPAPLPPTPVAPTTPADAGSKKEAPGALPKEVVNEELNRQLKPMNPQLRLGW